MLVFGALLRPGEARDENEAKKRVEEVMERYESYCQEEEPLVNLKMVDSYPSRRTELQKPTYLDFSKILMISALVTFRISNRSHRALSFSPTF